MIYAGIGSRQAPPEVLDLIRRIAKSRALKGDVLRTGGAFGCDMAFMEGARDGNGTMEVLLPWNGFNHLPNNTFPSAKFIDGVSDASLQSVLEFHPYGLNLNMNDRRLHARNAHIIMGTKMDDPVGCVICWTENGDDKGGTAQALRIARAHDIPIFNLGNKWIYDDTNAVYPPEES